MVENILTESKAAHNSRFAKAGVSCFYDSEVLNSSFVLLMKFSGKNPRLRQAAKTLAFIGKKHDRNKKTTNLTGETRKTF